MSSTSALSRISFCSGVSDGTHFAGVKLPAIWSVAEQLRIGVVTTSGEAMIAHIENSVLYSAAVIVPCRPLAWAACA